MQDKFIGAFGAIVVYWMRAENLVSEHPATVLVLWPASVIAAWWWL